MDVTTLAPASAPLADAICGADGRGRVCGRRGDWGVGGPAGMTPSEKCDQVVLDPGDAWLRPSAIPSAQYLGIGSATAGVERIRCGRRFGASLRWSRSR